MSPFIVLSLIAGVLAIDDRAGWQGLAAQPVFAALAVGFVAGDLQTAMAVGLVLELVWLSILPMRGTRRPDQIAGAVVGAGTAALLVSFTADPRWMFITSVGVFVGLLAGEAGALMGTPLFGLLNHHLGRNIVAAPGADPVSAHRLLRLHSGALAYIFVVETAIVFVLLMAGYAGAERFTRYIGGSIVTGARYWVCLMPALGAASMIHLHWHRHLRRVLILSAVMVILVLWLR